MCNPRLSFPSTILNRSDGAFSYVIRIFGGPLPFCLPGLNQEKLPTSLHKQFPFFLECEHMSDAFFSFFKDNGHGLFLFLSPHRSGFWLYVNHGSLNFDHLSLPGFYFSYAVDALLPFFFPPPHPVEARPSLLNLKVKLLVFGLFPAMSSGQLKPYTPLSHIFLTSGRWNSQAFFDFFFFPGVTNNSSCFTIPYSHDVLCLYWSSQLPPFICPNRQSKTLRFLLMFFAQLPYYSFVGYF